MEHVQLGSSGARVSSICLGTMGFGSPAWRPWVKGEEEALGILERALELGINFWDTADMYSRGESERIVGRALEGHRDEVVLATKVFHPMGSGPNARGLSRKHLLDAVEASLERLGTDHIDLYQTHRYDVDTPIDETLSTLSRLVDDGIVNYLGASTMWAWQFARVRTLQEERGWHPFVTMQNHWNLLYREEEREMAPLCQELGVGMIPWSPLARGELAHAGQARETTRAESDAGTPFYQSPAAEEIKQRVAQLSEDKGVHPAQLSLAWLLHQEGVTAPIVGVTKMEHLEAAAEATEITLSEKDQAWLEDPYEPMAVRGWLRGGGVPRVHLHENEPER